MEDFESDTIGVSTRLTDSTCGVQYVQAFGCC